MRRIVRCFTLFLVKDSLSLFKMRYYWHHWLPLTAIHIVGDNKKVELYVESFYLLWKDDSLRLLQVHVLYPSVTITQITNNLVGKNREYEV